MDNNVWAKLHFVVSIFCKAGGPPSNTYSRDLIESSTSRIRLINLFFSVFGSVQDKKNYLQESRSFAWNVGLLPIGEISIKQQRWMNLGGQIRPQI